MTYQETIQYLESFINYEKIPAYPYKESLKLERVNDFLEQIGNPHYALKCIHVAGTKGKGSTCAFIAYILRAAGYKVGLYTSPHLADFRERIRILSPKARGQRPQADFEGMISRDQLRRLVKKLKPDIERYNKGSAYGPLSFFEVYTALAFVYFKEQQVDFTVLETGMGGRLDATNVVSPLVCAITPISYEHTQKLGSTLKQIAGEKAGIIKEGGLIVVSAPQAKEAGQIIRKKCAETGVKLLEAGDDIRYLKAKRSFDIKGAAFEYQDLKIRLLGEHQLINATVAVGVITALSAYGANIGARAIKGGLYKTRWPGRCEIVARKPYVILDGAQNVASARVLKNSIRENFHYQKLNLVLGISSDKDIKGVCKELYNLADKVILTRADNPRAVSPESLARYFKGKQIYLTENIKAAKKTAAAISGIKDLILVTGSLFVVGEFRND